MDIETMCHDRDAQDYHQFTEIVDLVKQSSFIHNLNVPHIVKAIAEFATGIIIQCVSCEKDMHLLPSELEYITDMNTMHHFRGIHCTACFCIALTKEAVFYEEWIRANCHFGYDYEAMTPVTPHPL